MKTKIKTKTQTLVLSALALLGVITPGAAAAPAGLPPIHHVYVIVLENENVSTTFGPGSPAPYLAKTLRAQGAYLPNYYGVGHASLDNYIAMVSGQAPNAVTQSDCNYFQDFPADVQDSSGQQMGEGCVYPASVPNLATQLDAANLPWRAYNDSMGADPSRESATCGHPAINASDNTQSATAADQYATRHDPFVYFHAIIDNPDLCNTHVVSLAPLQLDLIGNHVPSFTFITPSLCNDGHDASCPNGKAGGLRAADAFLKTWVPRITGSAAFRNDGGLLAIIFDEALSSDTSSCCGETPGPGSPYPGISGGGGGDTGAVLLSPYIKGGRVDPVAYNHYGLLRSVEDIFGLPHLGFAATAPGSFGRDVFACAPAVAPVPVRGRLSAGSLFTGARLAGRGAHRKVTMSSVGSSALTTTISRGRRRTTQRRSLVPCRGYTVALPAGHGTVGLAARAAGGGVQSQTLRF